jgi:hypothetical protein
MLTSFAVIGLDVTGEKYPESQGDSTSRPRGRAQPATLYLEKFCSRWVDGIIVYVNTGHSLVQDYLQNHKDPQYMTAIGEMERLQIKHEVLDSRTDIVMCSFCLYENN